MVMVVGAYWSEREESREAAAARIFDFLKAIAGQSGEFTTWYSKARSRAAALRSPIPIDEATIAKKLGVHRDSHRRLMPDLGFDFNAWDGKHATFSASVGIYTPYVSNAVVLRIDDSYDDSYALSGEVYRALLEEMVRAFDPEHAVVTTHEYRERMGATKPWEAGWFTYARGEGIQEHPFP
jgi:hypothetical protein